MLKSIIRRGDPSGIVQLFRPIRSGIFRPGSGKTRFYKLFERFGNLLYHPHDWNRMILTEYPQFKSVKADRSGIFRFSGNGIGQPERPFPLQFHRAAPRAEIDHVENGTVLPHKYGIVDSGRGCKRQTRNLGERAVKTAEFLMSPGFRIAPPAVIDHLRIRLRNRPREIFQRKRIVRQWSGK